jgi:hypothetical protein
VLYLAGNFYLVLNVFKTYFEYCIISGTVSTSILSLLGAYVFFATCFICKNRLEDKVTNIAVDRYSGTSKHSWKLIIAKG